MTNMYDLNSIKLEEFNNCPGKKSIKQYLYGHNLVPYINVLNANNSFSNDRDTLVIGIVNGATETQVALALGKMAVHFAADELSWEVIDAQYCVRIWWD